MTNKQNTVTVTMKENTEHKGLELYFDGKPSADILDILKNNGWHWHNTKKMLVCQRYCQQPENR